MRPAWLRHSRDEAELEALQTDVMRFLAILGLCLVAIFSLVQGAAREQVIAGQVAVDSGPAANSPVQELQRTPIVRTTEPTREQPAPSGATLPPAELKRAATAPEPKPKPTPKPKQTPKPKPKPKPKAQPSGAASFTLEFASAQALETLLRNRQVQLYASRGSQFWSVDTRGQAMPVQAPSSYYQMQADTVPRHLREVIADTDPGKATTWGVTLPPRAISQIQQLTSSRDDGSLLIANDGEVTLGTHAGRF